LVSLVLELLTTLMIALPVQPESVIVAPRPKTLNPTRMKMRERAIIDRSNLLYLY
jgi:hypothetical protein